MLRALKRALNPSQNKSHKPHTICIRIDNSKHRQEPSFLRVPSFTACLNRFFSSGGLRALAHVLQRSKLRIVAASCLQFANVSISASVMTKTSPGLAFPYSLKSALTPYRYVGHRRPYRSLPPVSMSGFIERSRGISGLSFPKLSHEI